MRVGGGQRDQRLLQQLDLLLVRPHDAEVAHGPGAQGGDGEPLGIPDRSGQRRGPGEVGVGLSRVARPVLRLGQRDQRVAAGRG